MLETDSLDDYVGEPMPGPEEMADRQRMQFEAIRRLFFALMPSEREGLNTEAEIIDAAVRILEDRQSLLVEAKDCPDDATIRTVRDVRVLGADMARVPDDQPIRVVVEPDLDDEISDPPSPLAVLYAPTYFAQFQTIIV